MSIPVVLSWSGGKDCALALDRLLSEDRYEVVSLLTTFTREYERVSMHGVRRELILEQARAIGLPLSESWIEKGACNADYEAAMSASLEQFKLTGVETIAFGDLYVEEIRAYRDQLVHRVGMQSLYPIWGEETTALAERFVAGGFNAITCCVDTKQIPESFCGRELDSAFFETLPESADRCGENGEFHSFVYNCPQMSSPIEVCVGETQRDGQFVFSDLTLATASIHFQQDAIT